MDLNVIKQRLESLNKQSNNSDGGNKNLFFKPSVGKQLIRVVPSKYNKPNPFTEMMFYYSIGSKRVMASPQNWGEKDPIMEFAKQLRGTNDKENWRLAKKLDAKVRIFAPIIVRGQESEGVKLWQFGKEVYQEFLNMAADDEIGDFTDIVVRCGQRSRGHPHGVRWDKEWSQRLHLDPQLLATDHQHLVEDGGLQHMDERLRRRGNVSQLHTA